MAADLTTFAGWRYSRQYRGPYQGKILIADLSNTSSNGYADISKLVTSVNVSYSMDMASQLSFELVDPELRMSGQNFFTLGRDIIYETQTLGRIDDGSGSAALVKQLFEISKVTVSQGPGSSPTFSIDCYSKAIQQMKRDKRPDTIKGQGTDFVRRAAAKYGLKFYGQETTKKQNITKASGEKQAESLWDVITRLAGDAKFVCFETDGYLIFASEQFLLHKWGTNARQVPKFTVDKKTGQKKQTGKKTQRWIPLQYPNQSTPQFQYLGTPGYFKLTQYPSITKSDNDPYAADGSCVVERINGTQIRPGMTAYVGNVPNMSGFYIIEAVSFDEMSSEPVSVSFRTPQRDEEKNKPKLLPIGVTYQQTYVPFAGTQTSPVTVVQSAKNATGKKITSESLDARLLPIPDQSNQLRYPRMQYANLTITYPMLKGAITQGGAGQASTNDADSVLYTGNINLFSRPVLPSGSDALTIFSITYEFEFGSEWRAVLLPAIYTQGGVAVLKSSAEVIAKYNADGGYLGTAKYLAVVRGETKQKAILNARDYAYLLSKQQSLILDKRFPEYSGSRGSIPNTAGDSTSLWV
jgi:hypothetical protein